MRSPKLALQTKYALENSKFWPYHSFMKEIKTLTNFIDIVSDTAEEEPQQNFFYRGHSIDTYKFEPSIFRTSKWRLSEHLMLRQMIAENPFQFGQDVTTFDKLVRAQHYGLPTRLLDVSSNPLVGLYFSCCSNPSKDGQVLIIKSSKMRHRYFDSDTISMLSNLAFLTRTEKDNLLDFAKNNGRGKSAAVRIKGFEDCPELDRLIQTVKAEKPHFRPEVDPFDLSFVVTVTPKKSHERIKAQEGQFLLFGLVESSEGAHLDHINIEQVKVPAEHKKKLLSDLSLFGISERTLFPEIDKSAVQIRNRYS